MCVVVNNFYFKLNALHLPKVTCCDDISICDMTVFLYTIFNDFSKKTQKST